MKLRYLIIICHFCLCSVIQGQLDIKENLTFSYFSEKDSTLSYFERLKYSMIYYDDVFIGNFIKTKYEHHSTDSSSAIGIGGWYFKPICYYDSVTGTRQNFVVSFDSSLNKLFCSFYFTSNIQNVSRCYVLIAKTEKGYNMIQKKWRVRNIGSLERFLKTYKNNYVWINFEYYQSPAADKS